MRRQFHGGGKTGRRLIRACRLRQLRNALAWRTARGQPIYARTRVGSVDAGAVEREGSLRTEPSGAGGSTGDHDRLLDRLGIEMKKSRIDIWIQAGAYQFRLGHMMPAFMLD